MEMVNSQLCGLWPVKVFKSKHLSKHQGKGGGNKHQVQPWPHRHVRLSLLPSMHLPQCRRKHWGKHGGIKHRLRSRPHGSSLPSILTETWLKRGISDSAIQSGWRHCFPGHKVTTIVNIIIYYLFLFFILILFHTYFYCIIEGANGHTFHYDYTLFDYMWQIKLELENLNLKGCHTVQAHAQEGM